MHISGTYQSHSTKPTDYRTWLTLWSAEYGSNVILCHMVVVSPVVPSVLHNINNSHLSSRRTKLYLHVVCLYRVRHLTLPILSWQYCLCGLWEGSLTTVVGFRVALDSVNNGTLVRAAAHILFGTVRVKQVNRICAARVSSEIWWWSAMWGYTFNKNNRSVGVSVAWDWIHTG
jgi:hypothetical protein